MISSTNAPLWLAVAPSFFYIWIFRNFSLHRPRIKTISVSFFFGILSIGLVVLWDQILSNNDPDHSSQIYEIFFKAFAYAAMPEEFSKVFLLLFLFHLRPEHVRPIDGMIYGVAMYAGFAAAENIHYVANGGLSTAITRAVTSVPSHCFSGAIAGYFVALHSLQSKSISKELLVAFTLPTLLHGLYDLPLMLMRSGWRPGFEALYLFWVGIILLEFYIMTRIVKVARREEKLVFQREMASGWQVKCYNPS